MTAKTFFKKIGRGLQSGAGKLTNALGTAAGTVLGKGAATYAMEAAPALLAFRTGGKIPGQKGKPVKVILHAGEYILPINAKPTKTQKAIVKKNKLKKK